MAGKFAQALAYLLPTGFAWPRHAESVLMRVIDGLAGAFEELHGWTGATVHQWQPARWQDGEPATRLAEWEAALGLPDRCMGANQSEAIRRQQVLTRLQGTVLPYENSSPAAPEVIKALCASLGYTATVAYNTPFRAGHRVGRALGALDGQLYITVTLPGGRFRAGAHAVGQRLLLGDQVAHDLRCLLRRFVPARFAIHLILI
ncbi:MAG: DUF2313 domain-containing protein [Comamonas sp.]